MAEIATAVSDEEVVEHMRDYMLPYTKDFQIIESSDVPLPSPSQLTDTDVISKLSDSLQSVVEGLSPKEVSCCTKCAKLTIMPPIMSQKQ